MSDSRSPLPPARPAPTPAAPDRRGFVAGALATVWAVAVGAPRPARAQDADASDPRLLTETVTFQARKQVYKGLLVRPRGGAKRPGLLLIPDQRGPNSFFRQLARRFALDGFVVMVPDLLSPYTLTQENSDEGQNILARIVPAEHLLVLDAAADLLQHHPDCSGAIAALGFVWGGSFALQFALSGTRVKAAVAYYVQPPSPDRAAEFKVPVQFHWVEGDPRSAPALEALEKRMIGAGRVFEAFVYPDTQSGFASEPNSRRFNKTAADHAYDRSLFFLKRWVVTGP
ncbi:dienelactone hydrolase family protein [Siculibacillus lacustris]|nr:dienelactone hydrolase family protein [Siculibacillus lacustris]